MSYHDQNDQRPILHISSNTFHQRKCFVSVTFVCNYPEGSRIAAAACPCTYLYRRHISSCFNTIPDRNGHTS